MARDCARLVSRVYDDHPLFELLENHPRGGQLLLDYATAWHGFRQGNRGDRSVSGNVQATDVDENQRGMISDALLEDALS